MAGLKVAICGATGAVGREMLRVIEEREFPLSSLRLLASERSQGEELYFRGAPVRVERLTERSFEGCGVALFSAGAQVSRTFAPIAAGAGALVVDNSSAFRMEPDVPLVVPEVNPEEIRKARPGRGIVANPNCTTIQLVVALKPLHGAAGLTRVQVSSYQSVSGAGQKGIDELSAETAALLNGREHAPVQFPHRIAFNLIPQIGPAQRDGFCEEEMKVMNETRKILALPGLRLSATTVRVPIFHCHAEAIAIETERALPPAQAREILARAPGIKVVDDPAQGVYPMPLLAAGDDAVLVGRIRADPSCERGLLLFAVADNLRKGAATNAVQIAQHAVARGWV